MLIDYIAGIYQRAVKSFLTIMFLGYKLNSISMLAAWLKLVANLSISKCFYRQFKPL